jgi:hypothetical protein
MSTNPTISRAAQLVVFAYESAGTKGFMPTLTYPEFAMTVEHSLATNSFCQAGTYQVDNSQPNEVAIRQKLTSYWRGSDGRLFGSSDIFIREAKAADGELWLLYVGVCRIPEGCPSEGTQFGQIGVYGYFKSSSPLFPKKNPISEKVACSGSWVPRQDVLAMGTPVWTPTVVHRGVTVAYGRRHHRRLKRYGAGDDDDAGTISGGGGGGMSPGLVEAMGGQITGGR